MTKKRVISILFIAFWIFVGQAIGAYFADIRATKPMVVKISECGKTVLLILNKNSTHVAGKPSGALHENYIIKKTIGDKGKLVKINLDALLGLNLCGV